MTGQLRFCIGRYDVLCGFNTSATPTLEAKRTTTGWYAIVGVVAVSVANLQAFDDKLWAEIQRQADVANELKARTARGSDALS